jgi:hypothetical protein
MRKNHDVTTRLLQRTPATDVRFAAVADAVAEMSRVLHGKAGSYDNSNSIVIFELPERQ